MDHYDAYEELTTDPVSLCMKILDWPQQIVESDSFNKLTETVDSTRSIHGVIEQIRANFMNVDDLAVLQTAIDSMREDLIERSAAEFERATHV